MVGVFHFIFKVSEAKRKYKKLKNLEYLNNIRYRIFNDPFI